tara:strand:- start:64 stop:846 length:783 start_codon:yes stop_codon:yes gene_type:complete
MDFRVAIPSIQRADTIKEKTLNYLQQTDIDLSKVDLFLSAPEEEPEYRESIGDLPINIIPTNKRHCNTQRNFMVDYYPEGQLLVCMDDDIDMIAMKVDDKNVKQINELTDFVNQAFQMSLKYGYDLWGVNPVINPYFLKNNVSFNLKYIVGCFYGYRNNHSEKAYVSTNPEYGKEDFERSIKYFIADGGVTRFNYVAPKTKYYSQKGGIQTYRTLEYEEMSVKWLLETFPMFCKRNTKSKGKYPEVRLVDQRKSKAKVAR